MMPATEHVFGEMSYRAPYPLAEERILLRCVAARNRRAETHRAPQQT